MVKSCGWPRQFINLYCACLPVPTMGTPAGYATRSEVGEYAGQPDCPRGGGREGSLFVRIGQNETNKLRI